MCGIAALLRLRAAGDVHDGAVAALLHALAEVLGRRGPDSAGSAPVCAPAAEGHLLAHVLHLRGDAVARQPHAAPAATGSLLCWNGEVFGGLPVPADASDTAVVAAAADACEGEPAALARLFAGLRGPWAMLYWHAATRRLWFGRDRVGRRSLLWRLPPSPEDGLLAITSVGVWWPSADPAAAGAGGGGGDLDPAAAFPFQEVPPVGLYALDLSGEGGGGGGGEVVWACGGAVLRRHPWRDAPPPRPLAPPPAVEAPAGSAGAAGPGAVAATRWAQVTALCAGELLRRLSASVATRVSNVQRPAGAAGAWDGDGTALRHTREGTGSPLDGCDGVTRHVAALQAATGAPSWDAAARALPPVPPGAPCPPAAVAILFSGGLDSMVMAALAHAHVPAPEPIDLLNVCFARDHASPDRVTALAGVRQLRARFPGRRWHLVRVDESFAAVEARQAATAALLAPRVTHMDYNIGSALWFAARGVGYVHPAAGDEDDAAAAGAAALPTAAAAAALAALAGVCDAGLPADRVAAALLGDPPAPAGSPEWEGAAADAASLPWPVAAPVDASSSGGAGATATARGDGDGGAAPIRGKAGKGPRVPRAVCRGEPRPGERCRAAASRACPNAMCAACCRGGAPAIGSRGGRPPWEAAAGAPCDAHAAAVPTPAAAGGDGAAPAAAPADGAAGGAPVVVPAEAGGVLVRSAAKVVLVGIGADEHMGGYARHRGKWAHGGWAALGDELDRDVARLWLRNLGRDDRVCSDHGREVRSPFLDEAVTAFLRALPLPAIVNPTLPPGVGDKLILRVVAAALGLAAAAPLVKRAIHFGSRIAKQSNVHTFGSNAAAKGDAVFRFALPRPDDDDD